MKGCSLWRRLAAAAYDSLLIAALWFFATAALLPFTGGQAIRPGESWYALYLIVIAGLFFTLWWRHGGQTPGMKAWRITILNHRRESISLAGAWLHCAGAVASWLLLGGGFWLALFRHDNRCLHDLLADTWIVEHRSEGR